MSATLWDPPAGTRHRHRDAWLLGHHGRAVAGSSPADERATTRHSSSIGVTTSTHRAEVRDAATKAAGSNYVAFNVIGLVTAADFVPRRVRQANPTERLA